MKAYLDIVRRVLNEGKPKVPVRMVDGKAIPVDGGVKTIGLPNVVFSHDMSEGFPLLTSKKMATKAMMVELEGFIGGQTDKQWYLDRGCKIWAEWANPEAVRNVLFDRYGTDDVDWETKKAVQAEVSDLGPIYGYQWRRFGEQYMDDDIDDAVQNGTDQLLNIVRTLNTNYNDRRMVCSAWNPNQLHMMALPPCHLIWNVCVYEDKLNLAWMQRSNDAFLGIPFNIASYATLLLLLAKEANLKPGNLSGFLVDFHLYENQIDLVSTQIEREPYPLPTAYIPDDNWQGIFDWTHEDIVIENYESHPAIKVPVVV